MDDAAARALAQSILTPGESLVWYQAAPVWAIASPAIFGGLVCLVIFLLSMRIKPPPKAEDPSRYWAIRIVIPIWLLMLGAAVAFGVVQTISAWSTAYVITDNRVVIVSRVPWTWERSFGPEAFTRYGISGNAVEFDWRSNGGTRGGSHPYYHARLEGLSNPSRIAFLIKENVAPHAERIDYQP